MRHAVIFVSAAAALAACNPSAPGDSGGGGTGAEAPSVAQSAYRVEGTAIDPDDGSATQFAMVRDGQKMRIEMVTDEGPGVLIVNKETGENYIVNTMGGQTVAMRISGEGMPTSPLMMWSEFTEGAATVVGPCSVAGENGTEYETTEEGGDVERACVTADGVLLSGTENGQPTFTATSVVRGPQPDAMFAPPEGVQVMDMSGMAEAMKGQSGGN